MFDVCESNGDCQTDCCHKEGYCWLYNGAGMCMGQTATLLVVIITLLVLVIAGSVTFFVFYRKHQKRKAVQAELELLQGKNNIENN